MEVLPGTPSPARPRWSRLAWASLALGLVPCVVAGLPAWILGRIARRRIRASGGALRGRGIAVAGSILGATWTLFAAGVLLVAAFFWARAEFDPGPTLRRVARHQEVTRRFVEAHAGRLPGGNWSDLLNFQVESDGGGPGSSFDVGPTERWIGINGRLAGELLAAVREPGRTVLYFEVTPGGWNRSGDAASMRPPGWLRPRVVGLADGTVRLVDAAALAALKWEP